MICGLSGVGRSTLINRLLKMDIDKTGQTGKATTTDVSKFEETTKSGIKVCIFDTPGFGDPKMSNEGTALMMKRKHYIINKYIITITYCNSSCYMSTKITQVSISSNEVIWCIHTTNPICMCEKWPISIAI